MRDITRLEQVLIISLTVMIILFIAKGCGDSRKLQNQIDLTNNLFDTLRTKVNKLGQEESRISVLQTEKTFDFLKLKMNDSVLISLQGKVKYYEKQLKHGGSVTVIDNSTSINSTGNTNVIYDTIYKTPKSIPEIFPVYKMSKTDKWYKAKIVARKDSTTFNIEIENKYSVVIGEEKDGLFKRKPFVEVTNENPYTKTKTLRTYEVSKPRDKRIGLGIQVGYGLGVNILSPYIGIGISYNLIKF